MREGKNENREVEQENRIGQIGDHLSRHPGAVGIIICEQPKAGIQTAALFAGLRQSDVEGRQPMAKALQRFRQRETTGQFIEQSLNRLAIGARRGIAFELLQGTHQTKSSRGELAELMIKLRPLRELSGRDDQCHW